MIPGCPDVALVGDIRAFMRSDGGLKNSLLISSSSKIPFEAGGRASGSNNESAVI